MIYARTGMTGTNVKRWQTACNAVRSQTGTAQLTEDGIFGPNSLKATITVQRYIGTKPDGIVGPLTVAGFKKKFPNVLLSLGKPSGTNTSGSGFPPPYVSNPDIKPSAKNNGTAVPMVLIMGAIGTGIFLAMNKKRKRKIATIRRKRK